MVKSEEAAPPNLLPLPVSTGLCFIYDFVFQVISETV